MSDSIPKGNAAFEAIAKEEWSRWRLVAAEDFTISYTEAFAMDEIDVGVANAVLDIVTKEKKKASKSKK